MDRALKTTSIKYTNNGRRYIEFECVRYVFDQTTGSFEPYKFTIGPKHSDLVRQSAGLSSSEAERRHELDGPNQIVFRVDTFAKGIIKEFTGIFYIYQLMMLLIWYYYAYYYMGIVLSVVIIGSGVVKVIVSTNAQKRVLEMATFRGTSRVLRDGTWTTVDCTELTPGDVIEIEASSSNQLSVDCVIVKGEVVADESSLTGEALPVAKFAIKNDDLTFRHDEAGKINSLFAGCYVLETRPDAPNEPVTAIVLSTGASTAKGRLVRDILYPMPVSFVFLEHLKIVLPMLAVWGVIMLILSIIMLGSADADAWFYGMFTISQVLSPLLPAVLVIGQSISSDRLRAQGIMCVDLSRITLAGKVKVFCFDKTGTLTKEGLDFIGAHPVQPTASPSSSSPAQFGMLDTNFASFPMVIKQAMHCCHSLSTVGGNHVGNFVDVEMFRATGATLDMRDHNAMVSPAVHSRADKLRTLKRFEFVHAKAYMSVIAQEVETGKITVFLKGSYERVRELVNPVSLPVDFDQVAKSHSSNGCYVLAVAKREIPAGVTAAEVVNWTRDQVEQGAVMAGLLLFRNELKPDTEAALNQLRRGGCRVVMITGDHINTGIHIARTCSMIRKDWQGQEPYVIIGDLDKLGQIAWTNTDDDSSLSRADVESLIARGRSGFREVEIAVTGKAFNALLKSGWMREYLHETRVFARMSPEDKVRCVRLHMEQSITAMCGDGGNDAGALKASHAGVALSEAQSSVVSHFSSRNRSIMSCVELLREARCSLDISFASYKYLIMYGEILAFLGLVQYYFVVNMSQALWILIDGSTVPVSWALTMARPARHLSDTRPTARLLGPETILSVVGQIVINIIFQVTVVVVLFRQRFFRCAEFDGASADMRRWWELADNFEGQATGLIGTFQILHAAAAFNIGSKYRTGFFSNRVFLAVYATVFAIISFIMLADPNPIGCMFHINCGTKEALQGIGYNVAFNTPVDYYAPAGHNVMSRDFRWILWLIAVLNLVAVTAWEGIVVLGAGRAWAKAKWPRRRDQMRV
ncbi:hypothetical protein BC831DRAFT_406937 [Entophlyctis helioformis]|nr:hypothetical protein BC831DRAFT_406937 [Entophlyctis helioformis]